MRRLVGAGEDADSRRVADGFTAEGVCGAHWSLRRAAEAVPGNLQIREAMTSATAWSDDGWRKTPRPGRLTVLVA